MKPRPFSLFTPVRVALVASCLTSAFASGAVEVAGQLLIDLDATDYNTSTGIWQQHSVTGIPGDFTKQPTGTPQLQTIGGKLSLVLDGDGDYFMGPVTTALLDAPNATHSVEFWAFQGQIRPDESIVSWSGRGGNPDGSYAGFRYGTGGSGAVGRWGGPDMGYAAPHAGGPAVGTWHHVAVTYDGTTQRVYVDGVLNASEVSVLDAKDGYPICIGTERNADATMSDSGRGRQFSGAVSKVRVHAGALTATQVLNNYNTEAGAHPGITTAPLAHAPLHRWSFNETAGAATAGAIVSDSIGGLTGVIRGNGATFTGTGVTLPGGAPATLPAYIDLPNGLVSSKQRITLEVWATQASQQSGSRMLSFSKSSIGEVNTPGNATGFNGSESISLYANIGANNHMRLERIGGTTPNGTNFRESTNATTFNVKIHYAVTYDPDFKEWRLYRNGFLMETLPETQGPTTIGDVNNWLGRSDFGADSGFAGSFDEFRVYNYTLSESEIRGNTVAGPDTLTSGAVTAFQWTPTAPGAYAFNNAGGQDNWDPGTAFPDAVGATANMVTNLTGDQTVALNTTATLGNFTFGDADGSHRFTLAPGTGGVLEMNAGPGVLASLNQSSTSASNEISAPILLTSGTELANTSATASLVLSGAISGTGNLSKAGTGPVILAGNNLAYPGTIAVNSGQLAVGNGGTTGTLGSGAVTITDEGLLNFNRQDALTVPNSITGNGPLRFTGAGRITTTGTINTTSTLIVNPAGSLANQGTISTGSTAIEGELIMNQPSTYNATDFIVGDLQAGFSRMFISAGTLNAMTINVAKNVGTSGVVVQSGGTVNDIAGGGDGQIAGANNASAGVWGAYRMTGGVLNTTTHFQVGGQGTGIMEVENATVNFNGGVPSIGRYQNPGISRGRGLLDIRTGAVVTHNAGTNRMTIGEKGTGVLNVRSGGSLVLAGGLNISMGGTGDPGDGTVNLLTGGIIETQLVARGGTTMRAPFNFNGGTLRARGNQPGANQTLFMTGCNAYVYGGGALIDSNGFNIRVGQVFQDPTGNGVATIPVTNGGSGYLAPPYIELVGNGNNATAIANLTNGVVTSITITNPGTDYTAPPVVNIIGGGQGTGLVLGTPTLAANVAGNLVKKGAGSLSLEGVGAYTGATNVEQGTLLVNADHTNASGVTHVSAGAALGGTGILGGEVTVAGSITPGLELTGDTVGQLTAMQDIAFTAGSSLVVDIDDNTGLKNDSVYVLGNLDLTGSKLVLNLTGQATQFPYTIATFGSLTGQFASVPAGVTVVYGEGSIEITSISGASPYQSWIAGFFPGQTDPLIVGAGADPDRDGSTNLQEYAFGGVPNNSSSKPKLSIFQSDRGLGGSVKDVVMTFPVLAGTPAFEGTPSPAARAPGVAYTVEGSVDLKDFLSPVSVIAPVTTNLGNPPEGYEFRSFMLQGPVAPSRGFMRVKVAP